MNIWWKLLICRAVLGVGMGGKAAVVPVFLAEIAPSHLRGTPIMNWYVRQGSVFCHSFTSADMIRQVFDALGIFLGFAANLIAASAGE